jgi:hypothetical protein
MVSALLMLRRVSKAFRYAVPEDEFRNVFGAGVLLVVIGTVTYSLPPPRHRDPRGDTAPPRDGVRAGEDA